MRWSCDSSRLERPWTSTSRCSEWWQEQWRGMIRTGLYGGCCREGLGSPLGDWFEFVIGPPVMDLTAAPYGGARYPVEARMDERIFARFHLDAGIGDVVMQPLETIVCRDWLESGKD